MRLRQPPPDHLEEWSFCYKGGVPRLSWVCLRLAAVGVLGVSTIPDAAVAQGTTEIEVISEPPPQAEPPPQGEPPPSEPPPPEIRRRRLCRSSTSPKNRWAIFV